MIKNDTYTSEFKNELSALVQEKVTAFDMLVQNCNEENCDLDSSKLVSRLQAQYVTNPKQSKPIEDWDQNEFYQPNEVNNDICAVAPGKYSSFAVLKVFDNFKTDFPLDDDYTTNKDVFNNNAFSDSSLETYIQLFKRKLGVKISQSTVVDKTIYSHNFANRAIVKIKNKFLKMFKKEEKAQGMFTGFIMLKTNHGGYSISNVEKLAKIYDAILAVATKKEAKEFKKQMGKRNKEITFASQLFANVLMSRVHDLQDINNNKQLEKCFWLQFANTLNKYGFSSDELKLITTIGTKSAVSTCQKMGITKNKIVSKMIELGYNYSVVPTDETQAFLNLKLKDYSVFASANEEEADKTASLNISKNSNVENKVNENQKVEIATNRELIKVDNTKKSEEQNANDNNTKGSSTDKEAFKTDNSKVKKSSITKMVDKAIIKYLADSSTKLGDKINQGKLKGKKLAVGEAQLRLQNLILTYYVQASNSKPMNVKNEEQYNESEISKAKAIVKGVVSQRNNFAEKISSLNKPENQGSVTFVNSVCKNNANMTLRELFVGKIKECVKYCLSSQFADSKKNNSKDDVEKLLNEGQQFLNSVNIEQGENVQYEQNADSVKEDTETITYVPNFIIVDEQTKE